MQICAHRRIIDEPCGPQAFFHVLPNEHRSPTTPIQYASRRCLQPPNKECPHAKRSRPRSAVHQHDSHALDGRCAKGQFRSPRHADGTGAGRLSSVAKPPSLRSGRAAVAEPRPFRALGGACVDAAVLAAASGEREGGGRRRQADRLGRRLARRYRTFPPARQQHAGPPRVPHDHRCGNDHRAARPGARQ